MDGAEAQWPDWSIQLGPYAENMDDDMGAQLNIIEAAPERALTLSALSAEALSNCRRLYYVFAMLLSGGPVLLLKKCERGNGFECWRQMVTGYESNTSSRLHRLLGAVMKPAPFPIEAHGFEAALQAWDYEIQKWETLASDLLSSARSC